MKQILEIEVPDGMRAIWKDNKVVFENIKPQFPKTWEEFCEQNEIKKTECYLDTSSSCIIDRWVGERDISSDRNLLPSKEAAEAHLAYMQLHQLRDAWREGWLPDWKDDMQAKFSIVYNNGEYSVFDYQDVSRFLSFQDKERAKEFLECFKDLIKQAWDLI